MNGKLFRSMTAVVIALVLLSVIFVGMNATKTAEASTTRSWYWTTFEAGATGYTSSRNTIARRVANFSEIEVHASSDVSGTGTMTVTPQFSNQASTCAAITRWFTAEERLVFQSAAVTDTILNKYVELSLVLTNDTERGMELGVRGACMRFVIASSTGRFTPTLRIRMVNED